ncbi:Oxidoreductase domain protein [Microbacterium sp. C448]|uniref:Gfo/Idh/MocA family protein n=1 Tax=Microbacterium TaxID=33882 RepID=UPI0003DE34A2|nr:MULTISPECIES: Gfo/Idh/MocA family oxidoreductase [Microbacterium]CDJ99820.1 Oxidoreductase domain protein [Microbacterium sp. C448]
MLRTVLIGVTHWHLPLFLEPMQKRDDLSYVGVSDPDLAGAQKVAERLGTIALADYRELVEQTKPDFALVLGIHAEMAATAEFLIERGIPFIIEKPAGLNGAQVSHIAELAAERDAFAAVPFVFRQNGWVTRMREHSAGERFDHLSFTMIGRPPQQYERMASGWVLDRARSGGGALINLGIHFLDLIPYLVPDEPVEVVGAAISNTAWDLSIEDYASVILKVGTSLATIQTGYRYTSPDEYMDMHFSVRTAASYYVARTPTEVQVTTPEGGIETWEVSTMNMKTYPFFVNDAIERVLRGDMPAFDLSDAARAMRLLDRIYEKAGAILPSTPGSVTQE